MTVYKVALRDTTPFVDYTFRVRPTNQHAVGEWSLDSPPAQFNENDAEGGKTAEIENYLGTGMWWRTHTFDSVGTFDFDKKLQLDPWHILVIGGGGNGNNGGNSGAGGGRTAEKSITWDDGLYQVKVGNTGQQSAIINPDGSDFRRVNGGASNQGSSGGGFYSDISGTNRGYAGNGGRVWWNHCCPANGDAPGPGGGSWDCGPKNANYFGGGGGGTQHTCPSGGTGHRGIVIIAYPLRNGPV